MPNANKPKFSFLNWFLIFMLVFLGIKILFPSEQKDPEVIEETKAVELTTTKDNYTDGETVVVKLQNNTEKTYYLSEYCPSNPFSISKLPEGDSVIIQDNLTETSADTQAECNPAQELKPNQTLEISMASWNEELFGEGGKYFITETLTTTNENGEVETLTVNKQFEISNRNMFGWAWEKAFYVPMYNALVWIASALPAHNLGWAIIILTLIVKLILLVPNQHAMRSQRAMKELQPKLDEIKRKYASDPQKQSMETMALWKKHKINPLGGCLPMLVQFPIIIGLFYVVRSVNDGFSSSDIANLWGSLANFDVSQIQTTFLGIDMGATGIIWLAILIALLQFIQMSMTLGKSKKAKATGKGVTEKKSQSMGDAMAMSTSTMKYIMPLMIGFMSFTFPAGISLYWGMSTLFGIGQQAVVNREKIL